MYSIFFWILAFLWLIGIFVPDSVYVVRGRSVIILAMLILLGLSVYPFHK